VGRGGELKTIHKVMEDDILLAAIIEYYRGQFLFDLTIMMKKDTQRVVRTILSHSD